MSNILRQLGNFGVSHYLCPADVPLLSFLDATVAAGFSCVGLTERALHELPLPTINRELRVRELTVSSVNTAGYFLFEGKQREDQERTNEFLLNAASELQAVNGVNLIVGGSHAITLKDARALAFQKSSELAHRAQSLGTRLLLEPMHPIQTSGKGCVNTLRQAEHWTESIAGLTLNLDLFHSWWDPDLAPTLEGIMAPIAVIQICDVSVSPETMMPARVPLGEGQIDWRSPVMHMISQDRSRPIEVELFASQLPGRDCLELLERTAEQLTALFKGKDE